MHTHLPTRPKLLKAAAKLILCPNESRCSTADWLLKKKKRKRCQIDEGQANCHGDDHSSWKCHLSCDDTLSIPYNSVKWNWKLYRKFSERKKKKETKITKQPPQKEKQKKDEASNNSSLSPREKLMASATSPEWKQESFISSSKKYYILLGTCWHKKLGGWNTAQQQIRKLEQFGEWERRADRARRHPRRV
jgi:hypothetical protein